MSISIAEAKSIREQLGLTHLVIWGVDQKGIQHVATHGESEIDAVGAAVVGNQIKTMLGWDESLCKPKPMPRTCGNCCYFERDYGTFCVNGWSQDGRSGKCLSEPTARRTEEQHGCRYFSPKG